ncbi:response regulator [Porphyromonas sp.]|uniref:hybrid sensor histidine kinase/response regulator transcription factor n=2 Tax=Porphyromonas sp. TaxID=1924944 RepID=UPI003AAE28EF
MRRILSVLPSLLVVVSLLVSSCQQTDSVTFTPAERNAADSLVRSVSDMDSLARLQMRLEREGDMLGSIVALRVLGDAQRNESAFDDALTTQSEGLNQAETIQDTLEWVRALNNVGTDYRRMGILDIAQEYHYQAWRLCKVTTDTSFVAIKNQARSLNGLGNIYLTLCNYERADSALRKSLLIEEQLGSMVGLAINYANIGSIFERQGQIDSAWVYYRYSMEANQKAGSTLGIALSHSNFGSLYEREHRYDEAAREYEAGYQLMQDSKDEWHKLNLLVALAGVHNTTRDDAQMLQYLDQARSTADRIQDKEHLADIYTLYYKYYKRHGDWHAALEAYERAIEMRQSSLDMDKFNRMQNTSLTIERNIQNRKMNKAKITLEHERAERRIENVTFAVIALLLLGFFSFFLYIQRIQRRNHKELKKMSSMRETFFTNITHEFRTPLTLILGLSQELQQEESEQIRERAESIERQGQGLLTLINQLLDISKIKSSVGDPRTCRGNVTAHIAMIVDSYRDYASSRDIELIYQPQDQVEMSFVPDYVNKVFNNLLSNAFKFTPPQGKISITMWRADDSVYIDLSDTGHGMDRETVEHAFDPFYQAESDSKHIGTGIGLALVKQIVQASKGQISIESKLGEGTTFHIIVPIINDQAAPQQTLSAATNMPLLPHQETDLQDSECEQDESCRLLVIEDNHDIAHYIGSQFEDHYSVSYATDGEEGFRKAVELVPDLIITDLMMPGVNGLELCRQIRSNEIVNHIPIIVVTAKVSEEERIRGIEAGADAYLTKPFNTTELRMLVERLLDSRKTLRQKFAQIVIKGQEPDESETNKLEEADITFLTKVAALVDQQISQNKNTNVEEIASSLYMSSRQLYRKLKALTGYAPSAYILRLKIRKACELMDADAEMSLTDVAYQSGFDTYSNFSRSFKNICEVSPSKYRDQKKILTTQD